MSEQQGDVLLFQTNDNGDVAIENGVVRMSGGLETMAYLCLFGGNKDDDGSQNNPQQWWGNLAEEPARQYRSETQFLLRSIPAIPANLRRIEQAASRDLSVFTEQNIADEVSVEASIPALNRVALAVQIDNETFKYIENWRADAG